MLISIFKALKSPAADTSLINPKEYARKLEIDLRKPNSPEKQKNWVILTNYFWKLVFKS